MKKTTFYVSTGVRRAQNQGSALIFSLLAVVVLTGMATVFMLRSLSETALVKADRKALDVFYTAEAAAQSGLQQISDIFNEIMFAKVNQDNAATVIATAQTYVSSGDTIGFLVAEMTGTAAPLTRSTPTGPATYSGSKTINGISCPYTITFSEKSDPVAVGTYAWDFPVKYTVETTVASGGISRKLTFSGDFTVRVQRDNFARYALFINNQSMPNGTRVWFTSNTNFYGPIHNNDRFNFANSPTFGGKLTQVQQTARFYTAPDLVDDDHYGVDTPVFLDGFLRNQATITNSSSVAQQDVKDQARWTQTYTTDGVFLPNDGARLKGGIYIRGGSDIQMGVDASDNAVYTITQGTAKTEVTVDRTGNTTTVKQWTTPTTYTTSSYQGLPNGADGVGTIIYAQGAINHLGGTVQRNTAVTIAGENDVVVTDHVVYEQYTAASGTPGTTGYVPPTAVNPVTGDSYSNMLGIVSWTGNVRIGTTKADGSAVPNDINIHGTVLAQNGIMTVDNYDSRTAGGTATILGGVITNNYGAFGLFNSYTGQMVTGYKRNFTYDERMQSGSSPPYFPTLNTMAVFANGIADKIVWQDGGNS